MVNKSGIVIFVCKAGSRYLKCPRFESVIQVIKADYPLLSKPTVPRAPSSSTLSALSRARALMLLLLNLTKVIEILN